MKANCYKCKYRGTVPGDAHSRCNHPKITQDSNAFGALMDMMAGNNIEAAKELEIEGDPHGIRSGWFMWPANFDPVWAVNCNGFVAKAKSKEKPCS